ncbi:MAG: hypothetical protein KIT87_18460 [Anaerolineae bacterium]|nr:hypothetical protein [Anaerolineae bacterium]
MPALQLSSSARQAVIVAILVILSSFGVGVVRLAWMDVSLRALASEEQAKVDSLKQAISQTDKDIARAKTDDYVKDWAREIAKQTRAGEIPVVLVASSSSAPAIGRAAPSPAAPPPTSAGIPRWRALLDQLFGGR